jgi:hypothetical protein
MQSHTSLRPAGSSHHVVSWIVALVVMILLTLIVL